MEKYERDFRRNHDSVRSYNQESDRNQNFDNYQSRYGDRGNYFGMPDSDSAYRNGRSAAGSNYGTRSYGTAGGYAAGNNSTGQGRNEWQQHDNRSNQSRNTYGSDSGRSQSGQRNSNSDQYRYGDPNPYMGNQRNGGYERTRGTGWRSETDSYEGTDYGNSRYSRQDNSYITGGEGRRYESFGRDEDDNYGHNRRNRLDHAHTDRNEHDQRRSDNDYTPERQYGSSNRPGNSRPEWHNVSDKYNRNRDQHLFDHTDDNYPRSSRYDRHRSGPDWSADSAASDYSPGDLRG